MYVLESIWQFIQDQILGMKWLDALIGNALSFVGLDTTSRLGGSIRFFLYDVVKITVLLCLLIFFISYIQSYFPPERSKKILGRFHGVWANIISALLGTVTPFCSCSSIPLFIGFTSAGLPLGVTFSFLISSPMVDLGSLVLLMSIFGAKVAIIYVVVGMAIAVVGGTLIEKLRMERYVEEFIKSSGGVDIESPTLTKRERVSTQKNRWRPPSRRCSPISWWAWALGPSFTTGFPNTGSRPSWAATTPLASFSPPWWVSPCTRTFSAPSPWPRLCSTRGPSLEPSWPL